MFEIDLRSRKPIYEQVVDNFKRLIISGVLTADEKVPSVRDMAKQLTCNPNTVQKAYRTLEGQGYFYTVPGQGSFISSVKTEDVERKLPEMYGKLEELVKEFEFLGVSRGKLCEYIAGREKGNDKD